MGGMLRLRMACARGWALLRRRRIDAERDEELQFHLECEVADRVARGATPEDAWREAKLAFGGVQRFREEISDERGVTSLDNVTRELRHALRRLRRDRAFSLGVIATLGVGVGAAAAIGGLIHGVMLAPLRLPDPGRLTRITLETPGLGIPSKDHSGGTYTFLRERAVSFTAVGFYLENSAVSITEGEVPERVAAAMVTPSLLSLLGVVPAAGRLLTEEDAAVGFGSPVMISYALWQRRFGGERGIVGRLVELNRAPRMIAGVLPAGFEFPSAEAAIYYPDRADDGRALLEYRNLVMIGRLKEGVAPAQAELEVNRLLPSLGERFPDVPGSVLARARLTGRVETLREAIVAPVRPRLLMVAALGVVVLIIAFSNVATLALLRAERAQREVSVMRALGAGAMALRQRFLIEGLLLAWCSSPLAVGLAVSALSLGAGASATSLPIPRLHEVRVSATLIGAIVVVVLCAGGGIGAIMGARAVRGSGDTLRPDLRSTPGRGWRRLQRSLVAIQLAMAVALLAMAGHFLTSLQRLSAVDLGFVEERGVAFSVQLPFRGYETYQRTAAFDLQVVDALRASAGVTAVAAAMELPSTPQLLDVLPSVSAVGTIGSGEARRAHVNVVSPEFFEVLGIPLRRGRSLDVGDLESITPAVVLGSTLARALFGPDNPIGRSVRITGNRYPDYRVVGVSGDVFGARVADGPLLSLYFPLINDLAPTSTETEERIPVMPGGMHFIVRTVLPPQALDPVLRAAVRSTDPRVPMWGTRTLEGVVDATRAPTRLSTWMLIVLAATTMLLGGIGIFSVIAYSMSGRSSELALRIALGATPRAMSRLVWRDAAMMLGVGAGVGSMVALAVAQAVRGVLFRVDPGDPHVIGYSVAMVAFVVVVALAWPARQVRTTDPAAVLRRSS